MLMFAFATCTAAITLIMLAAADAMILLLRRWPPWLRCFSLCHATTLCLFSYYIIGCSFSFADADADAADER